MNATVTDVTADAEVRCGALTLSSKSVGSTHTIALAGELDLANVGVFQALLGEARAAGATAIVVDLEALTFIDSSGLAALVYAHRDLNEHGDAASCLRVVASPALGVRRVIEMTGLDTRLPFLSDGAPR